MKKFWVLLICCCGFSVCAFAQTGVGLKGGPLFSQLSLTYTPTVGTIRPQQTLVQGFEVGVVGRYMNNKHLGLQVEANYQRQGWHLYLGTAGERQRELEVLQVPLVSYLQMGRGRFKFTVQAGAFAGYIFNQRDILAPGQEEMPAGMIRYSHQEELPWQYGFLVGGGPAYHFPFGMLLLEGRFSQALSDLLKADFNRSDDFDAFRLQTITFGLQWVYMF